jgi:hypothetical protein
VVVTREVATEDEASVDPDTEFSGRVQLAGLAAFSLVFAGVTQLPRIWGQEWPWEHAWLLGPILGASVFYTTAKVLSRRWPVRRRDTETAEAVPATAPEAAALVRRVRRSLRWYRGRRIFAWFVVALMPLMAWSGHTGANDDQRLIDTQGHRTAVVTKVHRSPLAKGGPDITVNLDGEQVTLGLSFDGDGDVKVGDKLEVVQDPDDPSYVIAANSHDDWAYTWWAEILLVLGISVVLIGLSFMGIPSRKATRAVRHNPDPVPLTLEERRTEELILRDGTGQRWSWPSDETWEGPRGGGIFGVGELRDGGWLLLGRNGKDFWWPDAPLSAVPAARAELEGSGDTAPRRDRQDAGGGTS